MSHDVTGPSAGCKPSAGGKPRRKTGRPLSFDRDAALEQAMLVFWKHGYEASSLSQLTSAMGITPPSLYTAFGDKKRLFLAAVERYVARSEMSVDSIRNAPTARGAVAELLRTAAIAQTQRGKPAGCLLVHGASNCSRLSEDVQRALAKLRGMLERAVKERIEEGLKRSELPAQTDAVSLAAFYVSVTHGMSTQAQDGAGREKLLAIAAAAMKAWPQTASAG
ncbi:MAG TPA: TetR/AcrR family transcriptional regulator [Steroidobacteraceae bacterium]|jgi:AcrR family transcriptional regulator